MPIKGKGWEFHIVRKSEQTRDERRRTVGTYQVFHAGVAQTGADMSGMVAESKGPGANKPEGNGKRIQQGTYPLSTQDGKHYKTFKYVESGDPDETPKPGLELNKTGQRTEILIHPGAGFLRSVGCINLCEKLPSAGEDISFKGSRRRVIAVIEDLKAFLGSDFPKKNGLPIPRATVVIDGAP
jgi:hypothetical protein